MKKRRGVITDYRWRKKRFLLLLLFILFLIILPSIVLLFNAFRHVRYLGVINEDYPLQHVYRANDLNILAEFHTISTSDGEELWCSEIQAENPLAVVLFVSSLKEPSVTYYYPHARWLQQNGYASFLLETRAHGRSTGNKQGFGFDEVEDVRACTEYIRSLSDKYKKIPIVVYGADLGGLVAINSCAQVEDVNACIAVGAYASYDDHFSDAMQDYFIPKFFCDMERPLIHQTLRLLYGKDRADELTAENQIKNLKKNQVYLVCAMGDTTVNPENSILLQKANPNATVWFRASTDHFVVANNNLIEVEKDTEYCKHILAFLDRVVHGGFEIK